MGTNKLFLHHHLNTESQPKLMIDNVYKSNHNVYYPQYSFCVDV